MSVLTSPNRSIPHAEPFGRVLRQSGEVLAKALSWPMRVHANRQLMARMTSMSDYELSDIGLTFSDVADCSALPLDCEVGAFLAQRAGERRRARR